MANGYYDFKNSSNFTPYIGAGVGMANVAYESRVAGSSYHVDDTDTVFAYQAMAGIAYDINKKHSVYTGYKFFGAQDAEFKDSDGDALTLSNYDTHSVEVGYRYTF